ncbi:MAG: iron-siderophore ABC transporter substrate-binding protein [Pseudomonadota bacterium]
MFRAVLLLLWLGLACLPTGPAAAQAIRITDKHGDHSFAQPPGRVMALTWSLAEQVIELGVTPVGVADVDGYTTWVVQPPVPDGVANTGLRGTPNFERIAELQPDVILLGDRQEAFIPQLERIAPVLQFELFSEGHDNAETARRTYLTLSRLFGREAEATARLAQLDTKLAGLADKLAAAYGDGVLKVSVVRFAGATSVRAYGANSMPEAALTALGIESAWPQPVSKWGFVTRPVTEMGGIAEGIVFYIGPLEMEEEVLNSPLWNAMPVSSEGRLHGLDPVWTYGGVFSIGYLAELIAGKLLEIAPR